MILRCLTILFQFIVGIMFLNHGVHASENRVLIQPEKILCNLGDYGTVQNQTAYSLINSINKSGLTKPYVDGVTTLTEAISKPGDIKHVFSANAASDGLTLYPTDRGNGINAEFVITLPRKSMIDGVVLWNSAFPNTVKSAKFFYDADDDNDGKFDINAIQPARSNNSSGGYYTFARGVVGGPFEAQFREFEIPGRAKFIYMEVLQYVNEYVALGEIAFTSSTPSYSAWRSKLKLPPVEPGVDSDLGYWAMGDGTLLSHPTPLDPPTATDSIWGGVDSNIPGRVLDLWIPNDPPSGNDTTAQYTANPYNPPAVVVENVGFAVPVFNSRFLLNGVLQVSYKQVREFKKTVITYTTSGRKTTKNTKITVVRVTDSWCDSFNWPSTKLILEGPNWNQWTLNLPDAGTNVEIQLESRGNSGAWIGFSPPLVLPIGSKNTQPGVPLTGNLPFGHSQVRARIVAPDPDLNNKEVSVVKGPALDDLAMSSGTLNPPFAMATTSYTASVGNGVSSITVTPTDTDPTATVTVKVNGAPVSSATTSYLIPLSVGSNTIAVLVTAQDSSMTKTYTLVVTRAASSVATLGNLALSAGTLNPTFATAKCGYTSSVDNEFSTITVTPTVTDPTATVSVNGTPVPFGSASPLISLDVGINPVITVLVTAQDGTTIRTYTVTVTRMGSTYNSWANANFNLAEQANPNISGWNACPAGDGVNNLMKYAMAIGPRSPAIMPEISQNNGFLTLKYRRNNQAPDLIFTVQACDSVNNGQWVDLATSTSNTMNPNPFSEITVQDTVKIADQLHRFMRLKVTK